MMKHSLTLLTALMLTPVAGLAVAGNPGVLRGVADAPIYPWLYPSR